MHWAEVRERNLLLDEMSNFIAEVQLLELHHDLVFIPGVGGCRGDVDGVFGDLSH
jgi:hypothetical protein